MTSSNHSGEGIDLEAIQRRVQLLRENFDPGGNLPDRLTIRVKEFPYV